MNRSLRNLMIAFIVSVCCSVSLMAQNTFPATGRVGIYTTSPATSLQVKGGHALALLPIIDLPIVKQGCPTVQNSFSRNV